MSSQPPPPPGPQQVAHPLPHRPPLRPSTSTQKPGYKLLSIGEYFFIKLDSTGVTKCLYDYEKGEYFKATPENRRVLEKLLDQHPYVDPATGRVAEYWCCRPVEL